MALIVKDRVKETTTTTGTGSVTLAGASAGFQSFSVVGNGNTTYYTITDGTNWEVGLGTYSTTGPTLSRDTVYESSNAGAKVNWGAGSKDVFVTLPAEGGALPVIGQVVQSSVAPTNGTWLQTGKYYSKATYPLLATALGDVPDIGSPVTMAKAQIPVACTFTNTAARAPYCMATSGTAWVFGTSAAAKFIYTTDGASFSAVPPNASITNITGVWYVNSTFVATVNPGTSSSTGLLVSSDGITWTSRTLVTSGSGGTSTPTNSVAYGAGVYVIAYATSNSLYYSSNLQSFTATTSAVSSCNKVIFANSQFVAVGNNVLYTSPDGITWTSRTSPTNINYQDVIYANSLYVAFGTTVAGNLATSSDGITWTSRSVGSGNITQVIYAGGLFVAATTGGVYTSSDGLTWTLRTTGLIAANVVSVGYIGTTYYAGTTANGYYATSTDGVTWTLKRDASGGGFYSFFNVNSKAVGVGDMGIVVLSGGTREAYQPSFSFTTSSTTNTGSRPVAYNGSNQYVAITSTGLPLYSADGQSWTGAPLPTGGTFSASAFNISYLNGNYLICGGNTTTSIFTSTNGIDWTARTTPTSTGLNAAAFGASTYVAVGNGGNIFSSADLITWTSRTAGAQTFNDVVFGNSLFVAVGAAGACYTSPDGATWTSRAAGAAAFSRVIYVAGTINLFVAVGASGAVYTSPDGTTWTSRSAGAQTFSDIVYNSTSGTLVATGAVGTIYTSTDGTTWTSRTLGENSYTLGAVLWDGTQYTAYSFGNNVSAYFRSTDAITWTRSSFPDQTITNRVQYLGGKYIRVAGTNNNHMSYSTDGVTWTSADQVSYRTTTGFSYDTIQKVNSVYFAVGFGGNYPVVWTSTDGITFTPSRTAVRGFIAYNGTYYFSAWKGTGGSLGIYRSSNGSTWTHFSDLGTEATSNRTFNVQSIPPEVIWANGKLSVYVGSAAVSTALNTNTVYYSSDGSSWAASTTPIGGYIGTNAAAGNAGTDGTTIIAPFSISGTTGAMYKSTDGGVTWSAIASFVSTPVIYTGGYWVWQSAKTNDASTVINASGSTPTTLGSYNGYTFNIFGTSTALWENSTNVNPTNYARIINSIPYTLSLTAGYKEAPVRTSDNRVLAQGSYISIPATAANPIIEYPLFSYDTTTTFFVPQQVIGLASNEYIYAGA